MSELESQRTSPNGRAAAAVDRLIGDLVELRPLVETDLPALVRIRSTPQVKARWRGEDDIEAEMQFDVDDDEVEQYVITLGDAGGETVTTIGMVQWWAEEDPDYLHATIDIYVDPEHHGQGYGTDAVATLARHIFDDRGHHRITIDPAADNHVAIRSYAKVGFQTVGVLRKYERGADGTWHDGILMDLLKSDFE